MSQTHEILPILGVVFTLVAGGIIHRRIAAKRGKAQLLSGIRQWEAAQRRIVSLPMESKFKKSETPARKWASNVKS